MPGDTIGGETFPIRLSRYTYALAGFWTIAIAIVLAWEVSDERQQAIDIARSEALGAWKKEVAVYRWAADTGRIYVPIRGKTVPDANLSHLVDRDITTPSGHALTLISPPTIMSQVHVLAGEQFGLHGHITSLKPIRSQDVPDAWEKRAFEAFAAGQPEMSSEEIIRGDRYLRLMRPLRIEKSCLTCHSEQEFKVGDVFGGLSVAVPMASVWGEQLPDVIHRIIGYGGMWILGLVGITLMSRVSSTRCCTATRPSDNSKRPTICSNVALPSALRNWPTPTASWPVKLSRQAGRTVAAGERTTLPRLLRARFGGNGDPVGGAGVGRSQRTALQDARPKRRRVAGKVVARTDRRRRSRGRGGTVPAACRGARGRVRHRCETGAQRRPNLPGRPLGAVHEKVGRHGGLSPGPGSGKE